MEGTAAGADPPIDLPKFVTRDVRTELGKLDAVSGVTGELVTDQSLSTERSNQSAQRLGLWIDSERPAYVQLGLGGEQAKSIAGPDVDGADAVTASPPAARPQPKDVDVAGLEP
jgi:hypothetical protein